MGTAIVLLECGARLCMLYACFCMIVRVHLHETPLCMISTLSKERKGSLDGRQQLSRGISSMKACCIQCGL